MPTYVYACDACDKQFEKFQSFKEDPLTTCLICDETGKVRRVLQPVGVVFKGSGWYINDSRKNGSGASATDAAKTAEAKTETKTETKAETSEKPAPSSDTSTVSTNGTSTSGSSTNGASTNGTSAKADKPAT